MNAHSTTFEKKNNFEGICSKRQIETKNISIFIFAHNSIYTDKKESNKSFAVGGVGLVKTNNDNDETTKFRYK